MRFSSLGDVAMTVPVVKEFLIQNPETEIIYLSRKKFKPLFENVPNLKFHAADFEEEHKGLKGLIKLADELKFLKFDAIADLHNVIRSRILRIIIPARKKSSLNKGRKDRKALVRKVNKIRKPILSMPERYADVFHNLGYILDLSHRLHKNDSVKENAVGIAPFAMYEGKMYPIHKMRAVALNLAEKGLKVYLFGSKEEAEELETWEKLNPKIHSIAGKYELNEELELIQKLRLMISMDSANMHLASIVGTRVISIWGNTHPFMGFLGYGQSIADVVQDETMTERPTSVFGKESKNADKKDYFQNISVDTVLEKVEMVLREV